MLHRAMQGYTLVEDIIHAEREGMFFNWTHVPEEVAWQIDEVLKWCDRQTTVVLSCEINALAIWCGLVFDRQEFGVCLCDVFAVLVQEDDAVVVVFAQQRGNVAHPQPLEVGLLLGACMVGVVGVLELDGHDVGAPVAHLALELPVEMIFRVAFGYVVHAYELGRLVLARSGGYDRVGVSPLDVPLHFVAQTRPARRVLDFLYGRSSRHIRAVPSDGRQHRDGL